MDDNDVRKRSLLLNVSDRLDDPDLPEDTRRRLHDANAAYTRSTHELFSALVADDTRRRGDVAA